jgi:hypothetical protein
MSQCCCEGCKRVEFLQTAAVANGNGQVFDVLGYPAVAFDVHGTIAGGTDVAFEFLQGLANWLPLPVTNASDGTVTATGIVSAAGTYIANTVGLQKVRARVLNYGGADSINVVARAVCEGAGTQIGGGSADTVAISSGPTGASALQVQGTAADNAPAVGNPVQTGGVAVDQTTYAPGYTAGDAAKNAYNKDTGALLVDPGLPSATLVASVALAASLVIKAAAGTLISLEGHNDGAQQYIQVHNAAALPANGAVPTYVFLVPADSNFSLTVPVSGIPFITGIVVCNSSTLATKTIGAADCWFTAVRI